MRPPIIPSDLHGDRPSGRDKSDESRWTASEGLPRADRWPWWYAPVGLIGGQVVGIGLGLCLIVATSVGWGAPTILLDAGMLGTAIFLARRTGARPREALGLRRMRITPGRAVLWIVTGILASAVVIGVYLTSIAGLIGRPHALYPSPHTTADAVFFALAGVLIAPVCEEIFFRGMFYSALRSRLSVKSAVLIAATVFGLVHWFPGGQPLWSAFPRAVIGVALCLLYERSGSLYPGIAMHMTINSSLVAVADPKLAGLPWAVAAFVALVAIVRSVRDPRRKRYQGAAPPPSARRRKPRISGARAPSTSTAR